MPFTVSHVAAVLPLRGVPDLVPSALVVGSMSPDLPYFLPVHVQTTLTHSVRGSVGLDAAMGLATLLLWHGVLAAPAVAFAPTALRARLPPAVGAGVRARLASLRLVLSAYASLVVGALSHVLWDSFTHAGRWGTRQVTWLAAQQGELPGYRWAQYASGLVGVVLLALWTWRWWRRTPPETACAQPEEHLALPAVAVVVLAGFLGAVAGGVGPLSAAGGPDLTRAAFQAVTRGIGGAAVIAVGLALAWRLERTVADDDPDDSPR